MKIIAVEKIDLTTLLNNRVKEISSRNKQREKIRKQRVLKLSPYIAQVLFGMVEIHNKLIEEGKGRSMFNRGIIEDANDYVNKFLNSSFQWNELPISNENYTNVVYKFGELQIWLSDNIGCMKYNNNPIYQIYGSYDVKDFLNKLILKHFN